MKFRLATSDQLTDLAKLRWDLWCEDSESGEDDEHPVQIDQQRFSEDFVQWLRPKLGVDWFVWCALDGGMVVSQIYVQRIAKLPQPGSLTNAFGYVTSVYTRPEYRNQGVGTALLNATKQWASASNLEFLVLWPSIDSIPFWNQGNFYANESLLCEISTEIE